MACVRFSSGNKKGLESQDLSSNLWCRGGLESSATSHVFAGFKVCAVFDLLTNLLTICFVPT